MKRVHWAAILVLFLSILPVAYAQLDVPPGDPLQSEQVDATWATYQPRYQATICPFFSMGGYDQAIISCGHVLVPEDRTNPNSRLIKLALMRVASTTAQPPAGALIRLDGGPGQASVNIGRARFYSSPASRPFRDVSEIIFFDQRGTGYSEPDFCRAIPFAYQFAEENLRASIDAHTESMRDCLAQAEQRGIPLAAYNNWQNALDVRDLRRALGFEEWSVFGVSYGSHLGQAVLQVDADHIRSAVLDSIVPTGLAGTEIRGSALATAMEASLAKIAAACPADAKCHNSLSDLPQKVARLAQVYDDNPLRITGLPQDRAAHGELVLDGPLLVALIFQLLYFHDYYADIPVLLDVLNQRDEGAIKAYAEVLGYPTNHIWGSGMAAIINCRAIQPGPARNRAEQAKIHFLGQYAYALEAYDCASLLDMAPDPSQKPTQSDVPILVANGATDPVTPPWGARAILPGFSQATYVEFDYTGHAPLLTTGACGQSILLSFLRDPKAELDTLCATSKLAPEFTTHWRNTSALYQQIRQIQAGHWPALSIGLGLILVLAVGVFPTHMLLYFGATRLQRPHPIQAWRGPVVSWFAAILTLISLALAAYLISQWVTAHPLIVPVGLPPAIAFAGTLSLLAVGAALYGGYYTIRAFASHHSSIGQVIASGVIFCACLGIFIKLVLLGAGPV